MSWGVEFDPVNVDDVPEARDELRRLGVPLVPALALGERAVHGWNPPAYADLLGVAYRPVARLAPRELAGRLDQILGASEGLLALVPRPLMGFTPPERARPLRDLGFHVFRLALAFVDGMGRGELPEAWLQETAPADLDDGASLARYGARVRARVSEWFEGATAADFERVVRVYYGPQSGHELLERTAWHAAQHLRQLYALAERLGIAPPAPLPLAAFEGLPLPDALW